MAQDHLVPFSIFGLKDHKDRHLRSVLMGLGNPKPLRHTMGLSKRFEFTPRELASIWLADQHRRGWDSLSPEVKSRLAVDLLRKLSLSGFDPLFQTLFPPLCGPFIEVPVDYSTTALDILKREGLKHLFRSKKMKMDNILDFPFSLMWMVDEEDDIHFNPCPRECDSFFDDDCSCSPECICRFLCNCVGRPLYLAFFIERPDLVRLLLNLGASLPLDDLCSCRRRIGGHPLKNIFHRVALNGQDVRRPRDLISLRLLLADLPASFRHTVRSRFPYFADDIEEVPSMQHVARARIRHQLRAARSISRPGALERCGLPKCLQSYVYLDDIVVDV